MVLLPTCKLDWILLFCTFCQSLPNFQFMFIHIIFLSSMCSWESCQSFDGCCLMMPEDHYLSLAITRTMQILVTLEIVYQLRKKCLNRCFFVIVYHFLKIMPFSFCFITNFVVIFLLKTTFVFCISKKKIPFKLSFKILNHFVI